MNRDQSPPLPDPGTPARDGRVNVLDFGAVGDGKHDNAKVFQKILNSFDKPKGRWGWSRAGGTMLIPDGHWLVKETLDVPCGGITIQGSGSSSRDNRSCWVDFRPEWKEEKDEEGKTKKVGSPLFRFAHDARSPAGFVCRDFIMTRETPAGTSAFELWTGPPGHGAFRLGMTWDNVGIFYFKTAIRVRRQPDPAGYQVGGMTIKGCRFSSGHQAIVFEGATSVNGLDIERSTMRQHRPKTRLPALDIRGQGVRIAANLEGQDWALLLRDGGQYVVEKCHFEQISKTAIRAVGCNGLTICDNVFSDPKHFRGKIRLELITGLKIDAPAETWVLDRCRNVTSELGTWRGLISTGESK